MVIKLIKSISKARLNVKIRNVDNAFQKWPILSNAMKCDDKIGQIKLQIVDHFGADQWLLCQRQYFPIVKCELLQIIVQCEKCSKLIYRSIQLKCGIIVELWFIIIDADKINEVELEIVSEVVIYNRIQKIFDLIGIRVMVDCQTMARTPIMRFRNS